MSWSTVSCAHCGRTRPHPRAAQADGWSQWDEGAGGGLARLWRCAGCLPDLFEPERGA
jgi:hypothetical protein